MTPGGKVKAILKERKTRGDKPFNITQLANAMGKARESVSRRVNDHTAMTGEYPKLFADALGISPEELQSPAVEAVTLASLDHRLEALEATVTTGFEAVEAAIDQLAAQLQRQGQSGG